MRMEESHTRVFLLESFIHRAAEYVFKPFPHLCTTIKLEKMNKHVMSPWKPSIHPLEEEE